MSTPIITLTTDFGTADGFVGAMKGIILGINREARLVDIAHTVPRQDVFAGAMVLRNTWKHFPAGTIHLGVIDPGVGTDRAAIVAVVDDGLFVLPDNGMITLVARETPIRAAYAITNRIYMRDTISRTFHGRDVFAPVAAHLSLGRPAESVGPLLEDLVRLPYSEPIASARRIEGEIVYRDNYGNLFTNIVADMVPDGHAALEVGGHRIGGPRSAYGEVPAGEILFLVGSSDLVEIAVNGGNAAEKLGAGIGTPVALSW